MPPRPPLNEALVEGYFLVDVSPPWWLLQGIHVYM